MVDATIGGSACLLNCVAFAWENIFGAPLSDDTFNDVQATTEANLIKGTVYDGDLPQKQIRCMRCAKVFFL